MVRFAGQTPTMDNREELLDALNDFSRKQAKEIPPLLEQFLKQVAKTGETLFPWTLLKALFVAKLEQVMGEFSEESPTDQLPSCPNVENARFEVYRARIMEAVDRFHGAPFTIQRLCELLTDPKRHYKRCDKFMRGLEKNILVVSTVDPFGRKVVSESKNLVNGMDGNNSSDDTPPSTSYSSGAPPVPAWSSSSPTAVWPLSADIVTPSTSPLLEVCDLPDPKDAAAAAATTTTSTETMSSSASLNGHDVSSAASSSSMEVTTDSAGTVASSHPADSSDAASSSVVTPVTGMEGTVDNSDQQVAAEEMVGVEEEAASSTAISPEAAATRVVEEAVVETQAAAAEVKDTTEPGDGSSEASPATSGDWLVNITDKEPEAVPSSTESRDSSGSDTCITTADTSTSGPAPTPAESPTVNASVKQDTASAEAESTNGVKEGGDKCSEDLPAVKEGDVSTSESDVGKTDAQGDGEADPVKIDPVKTDPVTSGSDTAAPITDSSLTSSSEESAEEAKPADSSVPVSVASEIETTPTPASSSPAPASSTPTPASSDTPTSSDTSSSSTAPLESPAADSATSEASSTVTSSSSVSTTTTTTPSSASAATVIVTSSEAEESSAVEASSSSSVVSEAMDSSNSVPEAAENSQSDAVASSSSENIPPVQEEAGSVESSSQPEQMEQD